MTDTEQQDDVTDTLEGKGDQLNADDLIAGPVIVRVLDVRKVGDKKQPIIIEIRTSEHRLRPWKPCLTMRRLLVAMWGSKKSAWKGKYVQLYNERDVSYGGKVTGGVRMMTATLDAPFEALLTVGRNKKQLYKVGVLEMPEVKS